jgi:phage terminase large subunit GpA-like protein
MDDPATQQRLDDALLRVFRRGDGRELRIAATCQDSGGHHTDAVYQFSKARLGRQVWAIKGASDRAGKRSPIWPTKTPSRKKRSGFRPVIIGTQTGKDTISTRLQVVTPGPGYMHYPADRDIHWFSQITAERKVVKTEGGHRYTAWVPIPGRANEGLDCRVYAYAALMGLIAKGLKLNAHAELVMAATPTAPPPPTEPAEGSEPATAPPSTPARKRRQRRKGPASDDDWLWSSKP